MQQSGFGPNPEAKPNPEFGTIANTNHMSYAWCLPLSNICSSTTVRMMHEGAYTEAYYLLSLEVSCFLRCVFGSVEPSRLGVQLGVYMRIILKYSNTPILKSFLCAYSQAGRKCVFKCDWVYLGVMGSFYAA